MISLHFHPCDDPLKLDAGHLTHALIIALIHYQNRSWCCPRENYRVKTTFATLSPMIQPRCRCRAIEHLNLLDNDFRWKGNRDGDSEHVR